MIILAKFHLEQLVQVVQSPTQLKEQLYLYEDMMDPFRGYSAVKSTKKLVKHLERVQSQYNIAKDKVNICSPQGYCKFLFNLHHNLHGSDCKIVTFRVVMTLKLIWWHLYTQHPLLH